MDQTITCPKCGQHIPLSETISAQIRHQVEDELKAENQQRLAELEAQKRRLETERAQQLQLLAGRQEQVAAERRSLEATVQQKLEHEKAKLLAAAQQEARDGLALQLKDLENQNQEQAAKLRAAEAYELQLRKQARELEEQKNQLDLELERKLGEERSRIATQIRQESGEEYRQKLSEKDKQMEMLQRALEDARRKAEQGSMQIQGEVQEEDLKQVLAGNFPLDSITDVPTGIQGADLVQTVNSSFGQNCGVILWESKNTKAWSGGWLKKLKDDQAAAKADVCVLVSKVLPDEVKGFGLVDGVWVADYGHVLVLTHALRYHLSGLHQVKSSLVGRDEKMEYLYGYLSGSQFKNRMENIVMAFGSLQGDLAAEKRAMQRIWSKREKEIERVIMGTSGMYGDLQGIIGGSLPAIQSLELPGGDGGEADEDKPRQPAGQLSSDELL
ncbi:DUF2130 domain-containing protein [Candidatus Parcubacteria bacterium]|nr:DUF2130 domain-containing protein [Candidatus Parcubacteria bacterium]